MSSERPDSDLAQLATQLTAIANVPIEQVPELRAPLLALGTSVAALGRALDTEADDPATRTRIADELDRTRVTIQDALRAAAPAIARAAPALQAQMRGVTLPALADTLELVSRWLRAPDAENTAAVERLVAALRGAPGAEALWVDHAAEAKRKAELDADVQKSLDEIAAGMPKFKL